MAKRFQLFDNSGAEIHPITDANCVRVSGVSGGGYLSDYLENMKGNEGDTGGRPPQSFIDLWNNRCKYGNGIHGKYNEESGYFELNGLTDIGYDEAMRIMQIPPARTLEVTTNVYTNLMFYCNLTSVRTVFPVVCQSPNVYLSHVFWESSVEVVRFLNYYTRVSTVETIDRTEGVINAMNIKQATSFNNVTKSKLKKFLGVYSDDNGALSKQDALLYIEQLYLYKIKYDIPKLLSQTTTFKFDCWQFMINKAANTDPITITVHADVYAKLQGEGDYSDGNGSREEWEQLLSDATEKQILFATA